MSLMEKNGAAGREAERAEGERSEAAGGGAAPERVPDPELTGRPRRRHFSAEFKLKVLEEAGACEKPGEVGALLRRKGLYSSHLSEWRRQRKQGALGALARKRGRKPVDPLEAENAELRRRPSGPRPNWPKVRKVIEVQGNVSALLEDLLGTEAQRAPGDDLRDRRGSGGDHRHRSALPGAVSGAGDDLPAAAPAGGEAEEATAPAGPLTRRGRASCRAGDATLGALRRRLAGRRLGDAARR